MTKIIGSLAVHCKRSILSFSIFISKVFKEIFPWLDWHLEPFATLLFCTICIIFCKMRIEVDQQIKIINHSFLVT